ncbi:MAG TPA: CaiB/BaiF CoA-transferase family protein [Acidimicrobiales bacterium]|nr:CaiB/BaiF CoA-transferase family protein [Acidimicrobiales bacterium]
MSGPLTGLKVLELAGIGASPYACMLLADLGADVLRLERGDHEAEPSTTWDVLTRSRPSVALDLKNDAGRELVLELCEQADVLIEGFRPGVTERLGLGPEDVWRRNERLVYGRMTGYGQEGPLSVRAGHDINYVAVSGALWPLGRAGERPVPALNLVGDFGGGALFLVFGVLAAVFSAQRTGEGQVVDASMVDGTASMMAMTHSFINAGYWKEERGVNILDSGAHFYEVYETSDDRYVAVGAIEPKFYDELLLGLGLNADELPAQMDRTTWPEMKERLSTIFRTKTRDEWAHIFTDRDACVTPVLSPTEAASHPFNTARHVFTGDGATQPNPAPRFSKTPGSVTSPPRTPGSGTRAGLLAWGVSEGRLATLGAAGAFG